MASSSGLNEIFVSRSGEACNTFLFFFFLQFLIDIMSFRDDMVRHIRRKPNLVTVQGWFHPGADLERSERADPTPSNDACLSPGTGAKPGGKFKKASATSSRKKAPPPPPEIKTGSAPGAIPSRCRRKQKELGRAHDLTKIDYKVESREATPPHSRMPLEESGEKLVT